MSKETYDIPNVEIFGVGDWKGFHFDEATVRRMVDDTLSLAGRTPYARIKHDSEYDEDVRAKFGDPRFATLHNLRVRAGKVVADLSGVPEKIYQAIMRGILPSRSVELTRDYDGRPFVIDCVAFGGGHPEVKTLAGLGILEAGEGEEKHERVVIDYPPNLEETVRMGEDLKAPVAEQAPAPPEPTKEPAFVADVADERAGQIEMLTKERDALKAEIEAMKAGGAEKDAKLAELEKRLNEMAIDRELDALGTRITPAERVEEKVHLMELRSLPNKVRFGEGEVTLYERRVAELKAREPKLKMGETLPSGEPDKTPEWTPERLKAAGLTKEKVERARAAGFPL